MLDCGPTLREVPPKRRYDDAPWARAWWCPSCGRDGTEVGRDHNGDNGHLLPAGTLRDRLAAFSKLVTTRRRLRVRELCFVRAVVVEIDSLTVHMMNRHGEEHPLPPDPADWDAALDRLEDEEG
jgi:hypothetical protein